jgi:PEP-CTERM motif
MKIAMAVLAVLMFISTAHADSTTSIWNVTGTATIPGNGSCGGCSETINFSVDIEFPTPLDTLSLSYIPFDPFTIPGTLNITSSGPLSPFTVSGFSSIDSTLNFGNGERDDIAIFLFAEGDGDAVLFNCPEAVCGTDFAFTDDFYGYLGSANFTETLVTAPEPATWAMLLAGIALVGLFSSPAYMFRRRISLAK